jgi:transposase-like protein
MEWKMRQRLLWIQLYMECEDAGMVCRRYGISRPTLRKWWKRYQEYGADGLIDKSRKPKNSPATKVHQREEQLILTLRRERNLGARRIQNELVRFHGISISLAVIHKVLTRSRVEPIAKSKSMDLVNKRLVCSESAAGTVETWQKTGVPKEE